MLSKKKFQKGLYENDRTIFWNPNFSKSNNLHDDFNLEMGIIVMVFIDVSWFNLNKCEINAKFDQSCNPFYKINEQTQKF